MDKDDITLSHLLANPIYIKRQNNIQYSIDNEIIKLLNGEISFVSEENKGSEFKITLNS